jgi:hypothetical protein
MCSIRLYFSSPRMQFMFPVAFPNNPSLQGARNGVSEVWKYPGGQAASQYEPLAVLAGQFQVVPVGRLLVAGPGRVGQAVPASSMQ